MLVTNTRRCCSSGRQRGCTQEGRHAGRPGPVIGVSADQGGPRVAIRSQTRPRCVRPADPSDRRGDDHPVRRPADKSDRRQPNIPPQLDRPRSSRLGLAAASVVVGLSRGAHSQFYFRALTTLGVLTLYRGFPLHPPVRHTPLTKSYASTCPPRAAAAAARPLCLPTTLTKERRERPASPPGGSYVTGERTHTRAVRADPRVAAGSNGRFTSVLLTRRARRTRVTVTTACGSWALRARHIESIRAPAAARRPVNRPRAAVRSAFAW